MATMQTIQTAKDRTQIVVIGIGNEYRHDDAAGLRVARRLKEHLRGSGIGDRGSGLPAGRSPTPGPRSPAPIKVLEEDGEAVRMMEAWKDAGVAIVCDAISGGSGV